MNEFDYKCNYRAAIHWCNNNYIFINEEVIDESQLEFVNDCYNWDDCGEIFQYYISDCDKHDAKYLVEHFEDIILAYYPPFDAYILCVTHYGTSWDYCNCYSDNELAQCDEGELPLQEIANNYWDVERNLTKMFKKLYNNFSKVSGHKGFNIYYYDNKQISLDDIHYALSTHVSKEDIDNWSESDEPSLNYYMYNLKNNNND